MSLAMRAFSRSSAHHHHPMPSAVATRIRLQTSVTFWPMSKGTAALVFGPFALAGEEVDANHRSPARRSARPTATAAVDATSSGSAPPRRAAIELDGLERIEPLDRGAENAPTSSSAKPSTRDAPPQMTIRSMCSSAVVALKKSKVFSISSSTVSLTVRSTARTSSKVTPSATMPCLACSAASNARPNSF